MNKWPSLSNRFHIYKPYLAPEGAFSNSYTVAFICSSRTFPYLVVKNLFERRDFIDIVSGVAHYFNHSGLVISDFLNNFVKFEITKIEFHTHPFTVHLVGSETNFRTFKIFDPLENFQ